MIYFDPLEDFKVHNVKGMYMQSLVDDKPLLSSYPGEWWAAYRTDHQHYDRLFKKMFASWYPMDQVKDDEISEVTDEFRADVYAWLLANDKRYSEIYRINVIDDNSYDLLNNYDMTETFSGINSGSEEFNKGQETDTESNSYTHGARSLSGTETNQHGAQSKTGSDQMVYGARSKSGSDQTAYGATSESGSESTQYGSKTTATDATTVKGQHEDISINAKSAFNETTMQNTDKNDTTYGSETDTLDQDVVEGAHTDTTTISRSALAHTDNRTTSESETTHTDTRTISEGLAAYSDTTTHSESETARTDSESKSAVSGTRKDTSSKTGAESHTLHRVGNIGVQTATDMMDKANTFWGLFEFYTFIFKEIARELLRGC